MDFSDLANWSEYTKLIVGLIALVPPSIIVPFYLSLVNKRPDWEQRRIALLASLAFCITMLLFNFAGEAILGVFGISVDAFRIAGGLLLLLMALEMMRSKVEPDESEAELEASALSVSIVPLAIPILAGPGTLSTIVIYSQLHETIGHRLLVAVVIGIVSLFVYLCFRLALKAGAFFTPNTSLVFNRVMGLLVAAIAIEFMLHGIGGHFPDLNIVH